MDIKKAVREIFSRTLSFLGHGKIFCVNGQDLLVYRSIDLVDQFCTGYRLIAPITVFFAPLAN
ncbi:hypothetical protein ACFFJQ_15835 [Bacillus capparidis]|uniref:hypothetical protein n=1 Tax=Bacillus capparidis TaxID=1840411 RepID=UPI0035E864C0